MMLLELHQARSQPELFGGQGQIMERQNFFVYSDENDGIKCLCRYYTRILIITSRRVFYEFIMGNKHEVLGFRVGSQ